MTEEEARQWVESRWGASAVSRLDHFAAMVGEENSRQNLISTTTLRNIWSRHIVDSAQLIPLVAGATGTWFDIGTGGGFPGVVVAILWRDPIVLVEPRRRRADFLADAVARLRLANVEVRCEWAERLTGNAAVVSARAVKAPAHFFGLVQNLTTPQTCFVLPGGRAAEHALEEAKRHWRGVFHVEHSATDPASGIIVARDVRPK